MPRLRHHSARPRRRVESSCACEAMESRRLLAAAAAGVALDTTFGEGGRLAVPVSTQAPYDVAVDASGKLLVASGQVQGGRGLGALFRFNADGSRDLSFDGDGLATVTPDRDGGSIRWHAVLSLPDGAILVAGNRFLPLATGVTETRPVVARYGAGGTLDTTFGGAGGLLVLPGTETHGVVNDLALLPGGKVLAGGYFRGEVSPHAINTALWRLNPDGSPDATFGTGGVRRQDVGEDDENWLTSLAALPDGSFAAGTADGVFSFAADGALRGVLADDQAVVAPTADGKLLIAGNTESARRGVVVRRLLADGSPDASFGTAGATTLDVGATEDWVQSVAALPDGGVAVGALHNFISEQAITRQHITLQRLDAAGARGSNFGVGGLLTDPVPFGMQRVVPGAAGRLYTVGADATRRLVLAHRLDPGIVIDPGGPYGPVDEGGRFNVSDAGSSYAAGPIVKYEWDANFNGFNFAPDAEGKAAELVAGGDPAGRVVLRVTTEDGLRAMSPAPAEVAVRNAPPVFERFSADPAAVPFGGSANVSGSVADPGGDAVSVRIDFGDGTAPVDVRLEAFQYFNTTHTFANRGTYTVRATATDADGASSSRELTVVAAEVAGRVFVDAADDGVRAFDDLPFSGVTVFVDDDGDGALDEGEPRTFTNDAGEYTFPTLPAGTHLIRIAPIPGWRVTTPAALSPVNVPGATGYRRDFGLSNNARITGVVFGDANANGVRDAGELALRGASARNVYLDVDNDGWYDPSEPKATILGPNSEQYVFTNLLPGTYTVRYLPGLTNGNALENEAAQTFPNARGGQTGHVVTVGAGEVGAGNDFGSLFGNTPITGVVYIDRDRDGTRDGVGSGEVAAAGRVVYLDHDNDGVLDPDESRSRTFDPRGGEGYFLPVVRGKTYTVRTVVPEGWVQSQPAGGAPYVITVDQQNTVSLQNRDFGTHLAGAPAVVGRHLFYYKSAFGGSTAGDPNNDNAVAPDKAALLPGQRAGPANVSSYHRGINGVMVDLNDLTQLPTVGPVVRFAVGGGPRPPTTWTPINPLLSAVRRGAGVGGNDRIVAVFADGAIRNRWLRVTVEAGANTGLAAPDVFYFGNLVGQTGDAASPLRVSAVDLAGTRAAMRPAAAITNRFDHNRDGKVNAADYTLTRWSLARSLAGPSAPAPAAGSATATVRSLTSPSLRRLWQEDQQVLV